jgi:hypothetical protein
VWPTMSSPVSLVLPRSLPQLKSCRAWKIGRTLRTGSRQVRLIPTAYPFRLAPIKARKAGPLENGVSNHSSHRRVQSALLPFAAS